MDVEKTIEFLLEQAAQHDARAAAHKAQFEAESAEFRAWLKASSEKFDRQDELLARRLDRAIRMNVEEHRRERVRRKQLAGRVDTLDAAMAELAAAQAKTEKTLQQFIESMNHGRNGHDKS